MNRRKFITLAGGAVVTWQSTLRGQQATPVVGFLRNGSSSEANHLLIAFRKGLSATGYGEGRNVLIEYPWTDGQTDRLPSDLVKRKVSVIVALGSAPAVRSAKAATTAIPIVFMLGTDPIELEDLAAKARTWTGLKALPIHTLVHRGLFDQSKLKAFQSALFLASNDSSYQTGQPHVVDGGMAH